jgi:hypothetical protein
MSPTETFTFQLNRWSAKRLAKKRSEVMEHGMLVSILPGIGENQSRAIGAPPRPASTLLIIGFARRDIGKQDTGQAPDIDTQFERRRCTQDVSGTARKEILKAPILLGIELGRVLFCPQTLPKHWILRQ